MSLLNVERIKLFSTRSPYWCLALVLLIGTGMTAIIATSSSTQRFNTSHSQLWSQLGLMVVMVMAALAVTTEYRFGTIRNSFLAVPKRVNVLASKTVLVGVISAVTGVITAFGAFFTMKLLAGDQATGVVLETAGDWRMVAGNGLTFALASVIAIAVGTLIRQSAGAIALLMLWPMLIEPLFGLFGDFGQKVGPWLPFSAGMRFTQDTTMEMGGESLISANAPTATQGILVFAGTALVLWVAALVVLNRRDA